MKQKPKFPVPQCGAGNLRFNRVVRVSYDKPSDSSNGNYP